MKYLILVAALFSYPLYAITNNPNTTNHFYIYALDEEVYRAGMIDYKVSKDENNKYVLTFHPKGFYDKESTIDKTIFNNGSDKITLTEIYDTFIRKASLYEKLDTTEDVIVQFTVDNPFNWGFGFKKEYKTGDVYLMLFIKTKGKFCKIMFISINSFTDIYKTITETK